MTAWSTPSASRAAARRATSAPRSCRRPASGRTTSSATSRSRRATASCGSATAPTSGRAANEGNTLVNAAIAYDNATDVIAGTPASIPFPAAFSQSAGPATHTITVHEPQSAIVKDVTGTAAAGRITPGDTATYTIAVRNTGQSALHDVHVTDQPDVELAAVTPTTNAGLVTTAWAGSGTHDGVGHPGPDRAGRRGRCSRTPRAWRPRPASRRTPPSTTRRASPPPTASPPRRAPRHPGFTYRTYAPRQSSANLLAAFPRVGIAQTTGAAGNPESAPAEVLQPFTWRVVVTNTGTLAVAHDLDVTDVLPADWTYVAGSARLDGTPVGNPSISGQTLTWDDLVASLAPGASRVLTFRATPQTAARHEPQPARGPGLRGLGGRHRRDRRRQRPLPRRDRPGAGDPVRAGAGRHQDAGRRRPPTPATTPRTRSSWRTPAACAPATSRSPTRCPPASSTPPARRRAAARTPASPRPTAPGRAWPGRSTASTRASS